ncbi:isopeptide-forming domain-containing fimbrial protein [Blautia sp. MSJ-19]|uniref:isopeptide-forming domain-containing fimbrial protein n=1 Tax=Blautia sp. MSJ-19 TaxID=2841517 RepID=UPI001C0EC8E7|nr:isopeptide-forming domain-containing fimbrial protein [Blautia sp. MSJ-19]MBU5482307.1 isopeptide-forming domain-containing fimbrial protein [Blautia sp. MSJ-19]
MKKRIAGFLMAVAMAASAFSTVYASEERLETVSTESGDMEYPDFENGLEVDESELPESQEDRETDEENPEIGNLDAVEIPISDTEISFEENEEETEEVNESSADMEEVSFAAESEEELFADGESEKSVARATSKVPIDWVSADYKMPEAYAFTYAFRKGVTKLSYISRSNGTLNDKVHGWFGDSVGYTEEYCKTFYGCAIDDTTYTEPITALYSDVGEYRGQIVDLRVKVEKWGTVDKDHVGRDGTKIIPCVLFYKNRIAFNTISVGAVRFKFEFLLHNTQTQIYPKGHITVADLDEGQGIRTYDGWGVDHIYMRKGYDHLKVTTGIMDDGSVYNEIKGKEGGGSIENEDVRGWCQLDFNGSFTLNWLAQDSWKNSKGAQNAFYISTGQTIGTYEPNPAPEKKVGDQTESYETMKRHEFTKEDPPYLITEEQTFDYVIAQRLLPGTYSSFVVKDELDRCLDYQKGSVETSLGNDVTDRFDISESEHVVTFSAKESFLKTDEAYNDVTYYFRIRVKAEDSQTIKAHGHCTENDRTYTIGNTAARTIISDRMQDTQSTNESWIKGTVRQIDGTITVTKKIKEAGITWAHGNPVFRFRVIGTDQNGIRHAYEDFVEFSKGNYKKDGEYAVLSCRFEKIPAGSYTISELRTLRYQFESAKADTVNVRVSGEKGTAVLDAANQTAGITFTNVKTRYDRYSHTDVIRNHIPVAGKAS